MESCQPRVLSWVEEFKQRYPLSAKQAGTHDAPYSDGALDYFEEPENPHSDRNTEVAIDIAKDASGKTAAPRSVWYHGSHIKNLRSILTQGLIPNPKERSWADDPGAGVNNPSRQSYGGIYVTTNLMTAISSSREMGPDRGHNVLVCCELQPNTFFMDEDDINGTINQPLTRGGNDSSRIVWGYYLALTQPNSDAEWKKGAEDERADYIEQVIKQLKYRYHSPEHGMKGEMHPELEKCIRTLLPDMWMAALTRRAAHLTDNKHSLWSNAEGDFKDAYRRVLPKVEYDDIPPVAQLIPSKAEGEALFMQESEKLTRAMRYYARPLKENAFSNTARVMTPIGYSGSNRILAVLEIQDSRRIRGDDRKIPTKIVIHFGKIPSDFISQWKECQGSVFVVERPTEPGKTAAAKGIPSFKQFVAELGGPRYFTNKLQYQFGVDKIEEGTDDTRSLSMEEAEHSYRSVFKYFSSLHYPLDIYRAIAGFGGHQRDNIGTAWSLDPNNEEMSEQGAWPYGNPRTRYRVYHAKVTPKDIDWVITLGLAMGPRFDDEQEVCLKDGAKLLVVGERDAGDQWQETRRYVTAVKTAAEEKSMSTITGDLPIVGKKWDELGLSHMRIGWLRTQSHRYPDIDFNGPWAQLDDGQKEEMTSLAAEASQPGVNHKEAVQMRQSSGSKEEALNKVVRILGTAGIGSLVVGGIAVQEHGFVRNTKDIDLSVSDFIKARRVLAQNGYRMGNGIVVFDPEYNEEIDLLQAGQTVAANRVPMPQPTSVNTSPEFCDLATLINLKIGSFLEAEGAGVAHTRLQDRDDIYRLISNNQLARDFLKEKMYKKEYAYMWDALHAPPRKLSHEEAVKNLLNIDSDGLIAFYHKEMERQDEKKGTAAEEVEPVPDWFN
jgi:hypothetical protein